MILSFSFLIKKDGDSERTIIFTPKKIVTANIWLLGMDRFTDSTVKPTNPAVFGLNFVLTRLRLQQFLQLPQPNTETPCFLRGYLSQWWKSTSSCTCTFWRDIYWMSNHLRIKSFWFGLLKFFMIHHDPSWSPNIQKTVTKTLHGWFNKKKQPIQGSQQREDCWKDPRASQQDTPAARGRDNLLQTRCKLARVVHQLRL